MKYDPGEREFLYRFWLAIEQADESGDLPAWGRNVYPSFTYVATSCLWLEDYANELYESVCVQGGICKKLKEGHLVNLVSAVADAIAISSRLLPVPALTLSVLLCKYGVDRLCACVDGSPTRFAKNPFSLLTEKYFRDAAGAHPKAHANSFLWLADRHVETRRVDLAIGRLEDAELWARGVRSVDLPENADELTGEWEGFEVGESFSLMGPNLSMMLRIMDESDPERVRYQREKERKDLALALNDIGYLYQKIDNLHEGRRLLREAITLWPNHPGILDTLGWIEYRLGDLDTSVGRLRHAVWLDSEFSHRDASLELRYHLIVVLITADATGEALEALASLEQHGPMSVWCSMARSLFFER